MHMPVATPDAAHTGDDVRLNDLLPNFRRLRRHPRCRDLLRNQLPESTVRWTDFTRVIVCDTEFYQPDGYRPKLHVAVAVDAETREVAVSGDQVPSWHTTLASPKYLWVFFYAPADLAALLAAGAPLPVNVLDLYAEFCCLMNSATTKKRSGLLAVLRHYGIDYQAGVQKERLQQIAGTTEVVVGELLQELTDYCIADTKATTDLYHAMRPDITLDAALLRGRYAKAVARMEAAGIPLDVEGLTRLRKLRGPLATQLIKSVPMHREVYRDGVFYERGLAEWSKVNGIPWPTLSSGRLGLSQPVFEDMAAKYPAVRPLTEVREVLGQLRAESIAVGPDGRNRCMLSPFGSKTGRNQPSNSKYIWGQSKWMRGFIKPTEGRGIAYIDWRQQEFGIGAALSGDEKMMESYSAPVDPYVMFARYSGTVPPTFLRSDPGGEVIRSRFKACILGVQYGMGARKLANRIGTTVGEAQQLLALHRKVYRGYWRWIHDVHTCHLVRHKLSTLFGWEMGTDMFSHYGTIINFPVQANAAEMLRVACCCLTEAGINVIAPVHDAVAIDAPLEVLEEEVGRAREIMRDVSTIFLDRLTLKTDVTYVRYPDRYIDKEGQVVWDSIHEKLADIETRPVVRQTLFPAFSAFE